MRCRLCWRDAVEGEDYCPYHLKAYKRILKAYEDWRGAMDIGWEEFLREVSENPATGEWAREVALSLLGEFRPLSPSGSPSPPSPRRRRGTS